VYLRVGAQGELDWQEEEQQQQQQQRGWVERALSSPSPLCSAPRAAAPLTQGHECLRDRARREREA